MAQNKEGIFFLILLLFQNGDKSVRKKKCLNVSRNFLEAIFALLTFGCPSTI